MHATIASQRLGRYGPWRDLAVDSDGAIHLHEYRVVVGEDGLYQQKRWCGEWHRVPDGCDHDAYPATDTFGVIDPTMRGVA